MGKWRQPLGLRRSLASQLCYLTCQMFCQRGRPLELAVDVGCGSGQGTVLLAKHFASVVGTDVSAAQVEMALQHAREPNITYK